MTRFGTMWRRGFVLAASLALLASVAPAATFAQDEGGSVVCCPTSHRSRREALARSVEGFTPRRASPSNSVRSTTRITRRPSSSSWPEATRRTCTSYWAGARTAYKVKNGVLMPIETCGQRTTSTPIPGRHGRRGSHVRRCEVHCAVRLPLRWHVLQPQGPRDAGVRRPDDVGRASGGLWHPARSRASCPSRWVR